MLSLSFHPDLMNGCDVCHHGLEVDSEPLLLLLLTLTFLVLGVEVKGSAKKKEKREVSPVL